jgi:uncharacterized protein with HEPN domain
VSAVRRSEEAVIGDLLSAAEDAAELVRRGRDSFDDDVLLRRAGEAITGQITEAAGKLSDELKGAVPGVPWEDIIGMRIVLHHRYHAIDQDALWNVLEVDIPALAAALHRVVGSDD